MTEAKNRPPPITPEQRKAMSFQMTYLMVMILMLVIISDAGLRLAIGQTVNSVFFPLIGFGGNYPLISIVASGVIIGLITSIPRYFFTDWIKMGKIQNKMKAYSQAVREAYRNNNRDKITKLNKLRTQMMSENQQATMNTMKPLMVLTIFTLLIYIWLFYAVATLPYRLISVPWANNVGIATNTTSMFQPWILMYMFTSITVGYFTTMVIKYFDFTYKLRKEEESVQVF